MESVDFANIYNKYYSSVYHTIWYITRNEEIAEDLTQDTFLVAFDKRGQLKDETRLEPWLRKIAINLTRNFLKATKRFSRNSDPDSLISEDLYENAELKIIFEEAARSLPPASRAAIFLYYFYGMPADEIAARLGISHSALRTRLSRAKEQIREAIKKRIGKEE